MVNKKVTFVGFKG